MRLRRFNSSIRTLASYRLGLFLALCFILGGTSQDVIAVKIPLYFVSIALIADVMTSKKRLPYKGLIAAPILIGGLLLLLHLVYLIPLPPGLWSGLEGRDIVERGFNSAQIALPFLPLSLTPEKTLYAIFDFLPVIAVFFIAVLAPRQNEIENALKVIIGFAIVAVFLGLFQVLGGSKALYLYDISNFGYPVGFFSNANHQASFLAMILPITLYFALNKLRTDRNGSAISQEQSLICLIASVLIALGIIIAGSLMGYILLALVIFFTLLNLRAKARITFIGLAVFGVILSAVIIDSYFFGNQIESLLSRFTVESSLSRPAMYATTWEATKDFGFWGTGPGSFYNIYVMKENQTALSTFYAPQAHNDYLQTYLEFGLLGVIVILAFLAYYGAAIFTYIKNFSHSERWTGVLLIGILCPVLHSSIDYPLRTIAVAVLLTFYLSLMVTKDA